MQLYKIGCAVNRNEIMRFTISAVGRQSPEQQEESV
jgi:hypothetical protein